MGLPVQTIAPLGPTKANTEARNTAALVSRPARVRLLYVIGTYPVLTTTFIDREVVALRRRGATVQILSVRQPSGPLGPEQSELGRDVMYLLPARVQLPLAHLYFAARSPIRYFGLLLYLLTREHPDVHSRGKTLLHFVLGVYAAYLVRQLQFEHVHAHFIDRAAVVALSISRLRGRPFSVTAHANDIYISPMLVREKMLQARFVFTCTQENVAALTRLGGQDLRSKAQCVYHGIDLQRYRRSPRAADPTVPPLVLAVGQLKEKKGFHYLIEACRILRERDLAFRCHIVGEGPLRGELERHISERQLVAHVRLLGALVHDEVISQYAQARIFVLPCVRGTDGDQDGIPNVILEAMAMELPVVSTYQPAIAEAVEDGHSGVLVPPGDAVALANALDHLLTAPAVGEQLGRHARNAVAEKFDLQCNVDRLLRELAP